jgi:hypothetical protein
MFVGVILGAWALVRRMTLPPLVERHALTVATYGIGILAGFWFIERLAGFAT